MKAKYFDYLTKYSTKLESFLQISNLEDEINFFRQSLTQSPSTVSIGARRIAEITVKEIAKLNNIDVLHLNFSDLINYLNRKGYISKNVASLFHHVRKIGNIGAHSGNITTKVAENSLIDLDKILRVIVRLKANESLDVDPEISDQMFLITYNTFARKLIYVQSANNVSGLYPAYDGLEKIGDASVPDDLEADFTPNSEYLRKYASKRINQYMTTAGVPYELHWAQLAVNNKKQFFRDHNVHEVLKRSGFLPVPLGSDEYGKPNEWFGVTVDIAKESIAAVKEGKEYLGAVYLNNKEEKIKFRPEQLQAIKETKKIFKTKKKMLWNAKMRFGKTLSALQVVKESEFKKVLIMTHRPVVSDGWFEDFNKLFTDNSYLYGSKHKGKKITNLVDSNKPFVYFASIQDLRGSTWAGGKQGDKNREFLQIKWDLIIIDEAHEGNETELANNVKNKISNENTKILELSGTPFNLFDKYDEDNIFTWDYTMEQEAKERWSNEKPNEPNPYEGLPKISMYTFDIPKKVEYLDENKAFNFKEFFRVKEEYQEKFVHEEDIKKFLDYITIEDERTNYPYSKTEFRDNLRHTLWLLPGVKEANALEKIMKDHPIFGEYNIVNVVRSGDAKYANDSDLKIVRNAIGNDPSKTRTITLTVRKLTTGVNVPEWTGVFFLSNTESPTSYLQAAFRVQTPFNHEKMGIKENCYIFDFAPDRALKIMSESIGLTSKKGKINTNEQKQKLQHMLNFLPILGQSGNGMKEFSVDRMITQLKKAYADKAVRSGFEDTSLYNDNLLKLDEVDLSKFRELKDIVGTTNMKNNDFILVNKNGFDDEEYNRASKAERKKKKERTTEEEEALKKLQAMRKQRNTMVSILRGVSIRIPLMIYGMNVDIEDDITIEKFIELIDEKSWEEFMPDTLTKDKFKGFTHYYDEEIFIEAGRIIRRKAKSYDKLDVLERTEKLATLFSLFKNPDKETVLTPWRVVNMHLASMIGGLSFYDDSFENTTIDGKSAIHWIEKDITKKIYKNDNKILDINSKTGLYPLFVATSLYYLRMLSENDKNAGKFVAEDIWNKVLSENIFALAKTPMARTITQRTLAGYKDYKTNVKFIDNLVPMMKESSEKVANQIEEVFDNMKFDVIIGNPPYQMNDGGAGASAVPIYNKFVEEGIKLQPAYLTMITPSKWFAGGKGLDFFRNKMLNNGHITHMVDYVNSKDVFPGVSLGGGVNYFLYERDNLDHCKYTNIHDSKTSTVFRDLSEFPIFVRYNEALSIIHKIKALEELNIVDYISSRNPFGFKSSERGKKEHFNGSIKLVSSGGVGFIEKSKMNTGIDKISKFKLAISKVTSEHAGEPDKNGKFRVISTNQILPPETACTDSYLIIFSSNDKDEVSSYHSYLKTKFYRFLLLQAVSSINLSKEKFVFIPRQDFSETWNDDKLYKKYKLSNDEIQFIESIMKDI